jgi:ABC-type antimicrobial peptide transport system permease subunit
MTAAWMWARSELRGRWRSWVVLGILAGATFGLAAAGWAGARRTSVALPNYIAAQPNVPTAAALVNDPKFDAAKRAEADSLPEVQTVYPFVVAIGIEVKPSEGDGGLIPSTQATAEFMGSPIVAGRMADASRADEIVVNQNMQRRYGLDIGKTMTISQHATPEEIAQLPPGMVPRGVDPNFEQTLKVVGIIKSTDSEENWTPSGGFYAKYGDRLAGFTNEFVQLRNGTADLPKYRADMRRILGHEVNIENIDDLFGITKIRTIMRVEETGLLLFALAVLLVGGVLVGQALARAVTAGAGDLATWRAMGADRGMAVRALVMPAFLTAGVGIVVGVAVAIALSERFPIGQARRYDLHVGYHADWAVLGAAALAILIAVVVVATVSALWAASGRHDVLATPSTAGRIAANVGLPPALATGSRLAVEPGRGRRAVPVRSALVGAIVGVLGVVGCFTFRAGLADAAADPQRSGVVWDFTVGSGTGPLTTKQLDTMTGDRDVESVLHAIWYRAIPINGVATPTFGIDALKGDIAPVVVTGHAPRNGDEIVFGPGTLRDLKLQVGDQVRIGDPPGREVTVVGTALLPASSHTDYDQTGWMTADTMQSLMGPLGRLDPNSYEEYALIRWKPGVNRRDAQEALVSRLGSSELYSTPASLPTAVVSLGDLRSLPLALGVFFALLASATVAHALVTTVRRRRQELAIMRSIGFTRRQSRVAIAWQATLIAAAGLVIGVPLGIVAGRLVWRWLAHNFPVVYVPPLAAIAVLLVVPASILLANLLAAWPARSAARIRPAEALRTE